LIDLREAQECIRNGSIPGARFEPRGMLEFWAAPDSLYYKTSFQAEPAQSCFVPAVCAADGKR
jgi:hypothetical protein